ncbi:glycerate dehydrogenase [Clostridium acetobutylicum]|uniref:Possible phosphoglycerate dehydrogenase n=1 Tax=Clostridium acetobutylicum (strain ATCC 824 / DSM 792 / JCM 1419 / IAM 19013 / LMG 5710 / NBRC 13948 / NRRL B-527 / VKM B-1787 / 2291 / W) TaxID=272562 RepID=Q97F10_CLOAB|nr:MULTISPECIES: D-2-hydroxyacid dehydrogenase [Clostridium]AAK80887.1 Possible phosphoglycerate dehydrogenase [Clostridium acetobutylicum ATCC 824]ADZ21989.1 glycerate dehydrogenase [Clostridium acetobutylicum EA 2018]AEI32621.1 glycerate dehydrogenase [Clostridium acetobutylicum DSM 1731]AWV78701.1 D-2-hydroxyacid dehydrogenase [Clostridium acetobutylicum]MBC2393564.1 D-2-hydroxyacid dehydrogenase [Clostridium acetobutylicum]
MKIVVLDGYTLNPGDMSWEAFKEIGDLTVYDRTDYTGKEEEKTIERARDAEAILTNKTIITSKVIEKLPKLKYIGVLATGYNVVDLEFAKKKGIVVTNIPQYSTSSVVQMSMALILEICGHVGQHNASVKKGDWQNCADFSYLKYPIIELSGKTIGLVGYGSIGKAMQKAAEALGMKVFVYTPHPDKKYENESMKFVSLDTLFKEADVISLHCPLKDDNKEMINKASIKKMKNGVIIINTARGGLINERDLYEALKENKVYAAALDVVSFEPIKEDNPLLKAENCIITPHIAWATSEARQRLMNIAVNNLKQFVDGCPINVVNK